MEGPRPSQGARADCLAAAQEDRLAGLLHDPHIGALLPPSSHSHLLTPLLRLLAGHIAHALAQSPYCLGLPPLAPPRLLLVHRLWSLNDRLLLCRRALGGGASHTDGAFEGEDSRLRPHRLLALDDEHLRKGAFLLFSLCNQPRSDALSFYHSFSCFLSTCTSSEGTTDLRRALSFFRACDIFLICSLRCG